MSFFTQASFVMDPNVYGVGKLYVPKPTDGSGDLTFTRASNGTRVNQDGLIEKVRTNLLLQSNSFDVSLNWVNTYTTETGGQTGYDGSSNAWLLTKSAAGGRIHQNITVSGIVTGSIYFKANASNWALIQLDGTPDAYVYVDLINGVFGSTGSGNIDATITSVGGGWYRVSVTANSTTRFRIYPAEANGDVSGTSGSIYIQDAQLETGDIATNYIPTTTSAVSVGPLANIPRLNYGADGCPSLLLEPQRTNIISPSEQFNLWNYSAFGVSSIDANYATSPDGYQNADKINFILQSDSDIGLFKGFSVTGGQTYTHSIYIKGEGSNIGKNIVVKSKRSTGDYAGTTTIQTLTGEWTRVEFQTTYAANNTASIMYLSSNDATSVLVWGAQVEAGAYATSYIPTLSSAVTRVADSASKTGMTSAIGQTEGAIFLEVDAVNFETDQRFAISDGTSANRIALRMSTGGVIQLSVVIGSTVQASIAGSGSVGNTYKIAGAYKANDFVLYINGSLIGTDTSGSVSGTFSRLATDTGYGGSGQEFYNPIKQALLFKTRLSNADLARLTSL